jgi:uncharacterized protein (TIGR02246 family)
LRDSCRPKAALASPKKVPPKPTLDAISEGFVANPFGIPEYALIHEEPVFTGSCQMKTINREFSRNLTASVFRIAIALGFSAILFAGNLTAVAADTSDEVAIRGLVTGFQETWNRHDIAAMGNLFMEDADLINAGGMHWRGRSNIVKALSVFHRTMFSKYQIYFNGVEIRFIAPDVAIVVSRETGSGVVSLPDGKEVAGSGGMLINTWVALKRSGVWKLTHVHNTIVDPNGAKDDPVNSG